MPSAVPRATAILPHPAWIQLQNRPLGEELVHFKKLVKQKEAFMYPCPLVRRSFYALRQVWFLCEESWCEGGGLEVSQPQGLEEDHSLL